MAIAGTVTKTLTIKATRAMAKEIAKRIKSGYSVSFERFTYDEYTRFVSIYPEREMDDYNASTGKFSAIKILYPDEYYACPLFLTTNDLITIYNNSDKTFNDFFRTLNDEIEI